MNMNLEDWLSCKHISRPRPSSRHRTTRPRVDAKEELIASLSAALNPDLTPTLPGRDIPTIPEVADLHLISDHELETKHLELDFYEFCQAAWHVIEPAVIFEPGFHSHAICFHLQAVYESWVNASNSLLSTNKTTTPSSILPPNVSIRDIAISVPPRHGKSILASVLFPAWVWTKSPHARFMNIAYAHSLTIATSVACRELISSSWYQSRWGTKFTLTDSQNTKIRFNNDHGGFRIATSLNGTIIGAGSDFIIVDDLNDLNKIHSPGDREKVKRKFKRVISTRLNDPRTGCHIVIAQRGHSDDLIGNLGPTYVYLNLPARYLTKKPCVTPIWSDPRTTPGTLLNPIRFPEEELKKLEEELGPYDFAAQFQQEPVPADGGVFDTKWFQYYTPSERPDYALATMSTISIDMNFGSTDPHGSYVVGQVWCRFGTRYYLMEQIRGQWEYVEAKKQIRELWQRWPKIYSVAVEDKANGPALMSDLKLEIPCINPITPRGSKEARARSISGIAQAGNIYLPDPDSRKYPENAWVGRFFLPEVGSFPKADNDDQVDSMSQGINKIRRNVSHHYSTGDDDDSPIINDDDSDSSLGASLGNLNGRGSLSMGPSRFATREEPEDSDFDDSGRYSSRRASLFGRSGF